MLPHQCLCLTQKCDYRRFVLAAQTTTTEQAQSLLIFSEDRNIFQAFSRAVKALFFVYCGAVFALQR
jgi:hypothetical protein